MIFPRITHSRGIGLRWISIAALVLVVSACGKTEPGSPPPREVSVVKVVPRTVPIVFSRVAQTESSRDVQVVARVSGFLEKIDYVEGLLVKEGANMFHMDRKPFVAQVQAARGELEATEARLWTANANLDRTRPLAEADALSQSDLDQATGEQKAAKAAVYAAKAKLDQAELDLSYTTILAPVTGLTGRALQREGAYLNAFSDSANLSYVAQIDPIWVNFSVSQNELERTRQMRADGRVIPPPNDKYEFEIVLSNGEIFPYRGTLDFTAPSFDEKTGTFSVRAVVRNPDFQLRPGMFVTSRALGATRPNALVVPQEAVQQSSNGHVIWLVDKDNKAERRPVVMGDWVDDGWIVEQGLSGGEVVIVGGIQRIRPGTPVKPVKATAKQKSSSPDSGKG